MKHITFSAEETQHIGFNMGRETLAQFNDNQATVFALHGDLGSGKTTFTQGFARGLGVEEKILSPTFVIMKSYPIVGTKRTFYHIDCYRIGGEKDLLELGWQEILQNLQNIILLEWPDRINDILPKTKTSISFETVNESQRQITIKN